MATPPRKTTLKPVPYDASPERPPTAARPVRCRARTLAMDTHIVPHEHIWAQFTYCASGLMQVTVMQGEVQTTFIVPPSRAVWIPPGLQHTVVVLENAELRTVSIAPQVLLPDWTDCRVLVVSPLLREVVQALDGIEPGPREQALMALTLDEMHRADTQNLGVPMPHPAHGDKRLRALCEAVLRNPAEKGPLRDWVHQRGCFGTSWGPATSSGGSKPSWPPPCPSWRADYPSRRWPLLRATPATARFPPCSSRPWARRQANFRPERYQNKSLLRISQAG
jgi:quercetin dioxygenase-like cupin family protein